MYYQWKIFIKQHSHSNVKISQQESQVLQLEGKWSIELMNVTRAQFAFQC